MSDNDTDLPADDSGHGDPPPKKPPTDGATAPQEPEST
jgi:hypothetical protein